MISDAAVANDVAPDTVNTTILKVLDHCRAMSDGAVLAEHLNLQFR